MQPYSPTLAAATLCFIRATFCCFQARDEQDNPRLSGGDTFQVLLLPGRPATAPAVPIAGQLAAEAAAAAAAADTLCSSPNQQQQQQQLGCAACGDQTVKQSTVEAAAATAAAPAAGRCVNATADWGAIGDEDQDRLLLLHEDSSFVPPELVTAVAVGEVQDNGDGSYSCSYSHAVAGPYELHVLNGELSSALAVVGAT
jgi:hypothetical protein